MKWIGISGGWKRTNGEIEEKLRKKVKEIIQRGDGIVSGGALGIDYMATDEALKYNPKADKIKVFLPTTLERYIKYYEEQVKLGNVTFEQSENLAKQLFRLKQINHPSLIEKTDANFTEGNKMEKFYGRNSDIVSASDELIAFRVKTEMSDGAGTGDTVDKARQKGIPVELFSYDLSI